MLKERFQFRRPGARGQGAPHSLIENLLKGKASTGSRSQVGISFDTGQKQAC